MKNTEKLTGRERVRRTIEGLPVDRTPIDLGMHYSTGISGFAYYNLRNHLGYPPIIPEIVDHSQFLARVDTDIMERFHCDCICFHPGFPLLKKWTPYQNYTFNISAVLQTERQEDGSWIASNDSGAKMTMPANAHYFHGGYPDPWPHDAADYFKTAAAHVERIYKETDYYTMYIGGIWAYFSDHPDWLVNFMTDPEWFNETCNAAFKRNIDEIDSVIKHMGPYVEGICLACDLGTQQAPFVNPVMYEDRIAPLLRKTIRYIKDNSDYKIFFHSCGAMEPFIPILIDCGVDILNPVQISCTNMEPNNLKKKYGGKITFWGGGCNTQSILGTGSPEEVAENVKSLMSILAPGGGFVFNQVHNILGNVPPENIVAMLDTAYSESFKYRTSE